MSYLFFTIFILIIIDSFRKNSELLSPTRVYFLVYSFSLGVALLSLSPEFTPLKMVTWLVLFGSSFSFFVGNICANLLVRNGQLSEREPIQYHWKNISRYAICGLLLFLVCYGINYIKVGSIPAFSINPSKARITFMMATYLPSIIIMAFPAFFCVAYSCLRSHMLSRRYFYSILSLALISLLLMILTFNRGTLFWIAIWIISFENFFFKKFKPRHIAFLSVILIAGFVYMAQLRENSTSKFSLQTMIIESVYKYFANNFWNLDYALNGRKDGSFHPHTYGLELISPAIEPLFLNKIRSVYGWDSNFNENSIKVSGMNTISYQYFLYKDFGWIGVIFIPFIFSFLITVLFNKIVKGKDFILVHIYSLFFYAIIFSLLVPMWAMPAFWISLLYILVLRSFTYIPKNDGIYVT